MLEKQIEKAVCDYAKTKGLLVYKFSSPGHASVPDRMFIHPNGRMFMIEFKSITGKVTPAQAREHDRLQEYSIRVYVVHGVEEGEDVINLELGRIYVNS